MSFKNGDGWTEGNTGRNGKVKSYSINVSISESENF